MLASIASRSLLVMLSTSHRSLTSLRNGTKQRLKVQGAMERAIIVSRSRDRAGKRFKVRLRQHLRRRRRTTCIP